MTPLPTTGRGDVRGENASERETAHPHVRTRTRLRARLTLGAGGVAAGLATLHLSWALGARWGYSQCGVRAVSAAEAATGCGADAVEHVGLARGWLAAAAWLAVAVVAVLCHRWDRALRPLVLLIGAGLLVVSFPLHLLFEIPLGLFGEPTDWRKIAIRVLEVVTAVLLLVGIARGRCRHPREDWRPLSGAGHSAVRVAVALPLVGWTVPHLAWVAGLQLGIPGEVLEQGRQLPLFAQIAVTLAPSVGAVLTLGLARPWGQQVPGWVPLLGCRAVPRSLVVAIAGAVALLLAAYGAIGTSMMIRDLVEGDTSAAELVDGWAVTATELVFVLWGVALGLAVVGYARATRCLRCAVAGEVVPSA